MTKPRVKLVPEKPKVGELVEVKTLISHVMETGNRKDKDGQMIPRNIINAFSATFEGKPVFRADLNPGISANPYISFYLRVPASGDLVMTWTEDSGVKSIETVRITTV